MSRAETKSRDYKERQEDEKYRKVVSALNRGSYPPEILKMATNTGVLLFRTLANNMAPMTNIEYMYRNIKNRQYYRGDTFLSFFGLYSLAERSKGCFPVTSFSHVRTRT